MILQKIKLTTRKLIERILFKIDVWYGEKCGVCGSKLSYRGYYNEKTYCKNCYKKDKNARWRGEE